MKFLGQRNHAAFAHNVQQLVALQAYSHEALKALVRATGIDYHRLERGIAYCYTDAKSFDTAGDAAAPVRKYGVERRVVSTAELLTIAPALRLFAHRIVGGTFTASDESGDARMFTEALAKCCAARGAAFLYSHAVTRLERDGNAIKKVAVTATNAWTTSMNDAESKVALVADAFVVACGAYSAPLLCSVEVDLPIYPGKSYSATFRLLEPQAASPVSLIDDHVRCAVSRLGDQLRVAGTIEVGGDDLSLTTPLARARCALLARRVEEVLPGVADTRLEINGGWPNFWAGLRPAAPLNIPYKKNASRQFVGQRGPRHAGLDAQRRLWQGACRIDEWSNPRACVQVLRLLASAFCIGRLRVVVARGPVLPACWYRNNAKGVSFAALQHLCCPANPR